MRSKPLPAEGDALVRSPDSAASLDAGRMTYGTADGVRVEIWRSEIASRRLIIKIAVPGSGPAYNRADTLEAALQLASQHVAEFRSQRAPGGSPPPQAHLEREVSG